MKTDHFEEMARLVRPKRPKQVEHIFEFLETNNEKKFTLKDVEELNELINCEKRNNNDTNK